MKLDAAEITARAPAWLISVAEEVPSTNDAVRDLGLEGAAHGTVLFAEHQTSGRGRRDNRWLAPRGQDLMFSVLLRPAAPLALWPRITTLAALAICKGIERELPLDPLIKWPNDIHLAGRKTAGILAESLASAAGMFVVLGIGINVNTTIFPEELGTTATSLSLALQGRATVIDRTLLAASVLRALDAELQRIDTGFVTVMEEVRARSRLIGKTVRALVEGREVFGRAADLNPEGHLVLILPDGSTTALSSADEVRCIV